MATVADTSAGSQTFGDRLRIAMVRRSRALGRRITNSDLAAAVGVNRVTISNWLSGKYLPAEDLIVKIGAFLDVEAGWLRYGDWRPPREQSARVAEGSEQDTPRLLRNLPLAVREYLAEVQARLTRSQVPEDMIDEAMELLRSPSVFSYFKGGKLAEYNEQDVLDGMRTLVDDVVVPRLRKLGFKVL